MTYKKFVKKTEAERAESARWRARDFYSSPEAKQKQRERMFVYRKNNQAKCLESTRKYREKMKLKKLEAITH
jgi:hypothetical protein